MDWNTIAEAVVAQLLLPALLALLGTLGAWLLTRLPGPLRRWLDSGTHRRDLELLLGALARRGLVLAGEVAAGRLTREAAARAAAAYAAENLPGTLRQLAPSAEAMGTMAAAAVAEAVNRLRPLPAAAAATPDATPAASPAAIPGRAA